MDIKDEVTILSNNDIVIFVIVINSIQPFTLICLKEKVVSNAEHSQSHGSVFLISVMSQLIDTHYCTFLVSRNTIITTIVLYT